MLSDSLKVLYATSFSFFVKSFGFHHNVEGPDFGQLHEFFGNIYQDVYQSLDRTAEFIRVLGEYTPGSFDRFSELTQIPGQTKVPRARLMIEELLQDNQRMIELLNQCFAAAEGENQQGIANFIAERVDAHGKHGWQLRSFLKDQRA